MILNPNLIEKGAQWFHTDDYSSPSLSKNSLGIFFYEVLKVGAQVGDIWVFNEKYNRSPVYVSVFMTEEMKNQIELNTKFKFRNPPKININHDWIG